MTIRFIFARASLLAGVALTLFLATAPGATAACSDPAGPKVDWSGCDKSGADLYDAYLWGANLTNANLDGADLYEARLRGANLEGATLDGADLTDADLTGADLAGAVWTDGRICASGSIGACK